MVLFKRFHYTKRFLVFFILVFACWHCKTIIYGAEQLYGQLHLVRSAIPIEDILNDTAYPDSLKQKIYLIQDIRRFGVDSMGLNDTKSYTTYYDQKGKPVLWVVVAALPYKVEPYEFKFPIAGKFAYKGFFDKADAEQELRQLAEAGYDARMGDVEAWSSLGYLKDPILSNILFRSEGMLARLILHEMTHATVFVKGDMTFNENLATFVGDNGARYYLEQKYGKNSQQLKDYMGELSDKQKFADHILRGALQLDSLYAGFFPLSPKEQKDSLKQSVLEHILQKTDTISFYDNKRYENFRQKAKGKLNNAFFVNYQVYRKELSHFEEVFCTNFKSDFKAYISYMKKTHGKF